VLRWRMIQELLRRGGTARKPVVVARPRPRRLNRVDASLLRLARLARLVHFARHAAHLRLLRLLALPRPARLEQR
jgi:hypothetical protein